MTRPTSLTDPLTRPTDLPENNDKGNVPDDQDPDSSFPDSSSNIKKRDKKKKRRKHMKYDFSDPSSSDDFEVITDASDGRGKSTGKRI